jgi:hydroxypyruvate isomerase
MKLAPNLEIFFKDKPLEERFARIADLGFSAADLFGIEDRDTKALGKVCRKLGITVTMVVASELAKGLNDRSLHDAMLARVRTVAAKARELGAINLVVLSGNTLPKIAGSAQDRAIVDGLRRMAPVADEFEVTLLLEMLNSRYDHPGYYLDDTERMFNLVRAVNHPRVKGLYDIYHAGIMRGNIIEDIRGGLDAIGHFHAAGIPGRHEPKAGEQNYPAICRALDQAGYTGVMGLEYWPLKESEESLRETKAWLEG